jgi:ATP-binding cassette subfamily B protein
MAAKSEEWPMARLIQATNNSANSNMTKNRAALSFLFNAAKPFKFYIGLHLFVIVYCAIDISLWPYVSKLLIDELSSTPRAQIISEVWPAALLLVILTILPGLIWRICDYSWAKFTPLLKKKIISEAMSYVMKHSHTFFQNNFSGALSSKIRDLFNVTPKLIEMILYSFLKVTLCVIAAFLTLLSVHKYFAFGLIFWAGLFILMAIRAAKLTNRMSLGIATQQTRIMGNIVDALSNINNVKLFANSEFESKRIATFQNKYSRLFERRGIFLVKFFTLHGLTFALYFSGCVALLIWLYAQSLVTLGDFLMIFTVNNWIINEMWQATNQIRLFLEELGTLEQALSVINEPLNIKDGTEELSVKKGEIVFENVKFSYHSDAPIFTEKSVTIHPGQKVGLVGHSGGGKSTFVNLILRLFDVDGGRILIDGQDISKATLDSLHRNIGMIPQDPSLFHRSLFENIAYGADNTAHSATKKEAIEAAKKAHAHNFIEKMPQGYSSLVGERGIKLSGGQRQRISIARAFLKNAPILILDEATSQLDSVTENLIQESLKNLMENKTTLVIAHRLSTLEIMDRILVFDRGKIVEDGTHEELLALNGTYTRLWSAQVSGKH